MTVSEAQKRASMKYAKEKLHRIPLSVKHDEYDIIKAAATSAGESVNGYIKMAVKMRIESEQPLVHFKDVPNMVEHKQD